jgi:N,N-dimethylformamidase
LARIKLTGYSDQISVCAGETVQFMVSAEGAASVDAEIVRIIHGDEHPDGPGFVEEVVPSDTAGSYPVRRQFVDSGSRADVDDPQGLLDIAGPVTIHAFVYPTTPMKGRQAILSRWAIHETAGYGLGINTAGHLEFWVGDGDETDAIAAEVPLVHHTWYFVAATYDPGPGAATIFQQAVVNPYNGRLGKVAPFDHRSRVRQPLRVKPKGGDRPFRFAGALMHADVRGLFNELRFNGKIDRCGVHGSVIGEAELEAMAGGAEPPAAGLIARWDTSAGYGPDGIDDVIRDVGPNGLHAHGKHRPVRAMTGWNWEGRHDDWRVAPEQYGGIHFHDDAVTDCGWEPTASFTVPAGARSGCYALRVSAADGEDHIPFFVRPTEPKGKILFLAATNSYLAYANEMIVHHAPVAQAIVGHVPILSAIEADYYQDPEFGRSTYDHHSDGEGVCFSSWLRPILNLRPKWRSSAITTTWQYPRDLSIVGFLEHNDYDYEVATDHDLHREGIDLLRNYNVVVTCSHPEYWSERALDALEDYVADGGRLMYMGGNGFYWVVSYTDGQPHVMEVRKGEAGTRAWQANPGELYHQTSAERGGIWRLRGRPPQKLTGVGFTTEGFDFCRPYRRMPDSFHKTAAWILDGIGDDEIIGDFGLALGGAAGLETERYDLNLGTPPHALLLATADGFSDNYPGVQEDILFNHHGLMGTQNPLVRADMVYFTTRNNGAVWSTGSIAWSSSLPSNGWDNNVSRITKNVLDAFGRAGALPGSEFVEEEKSWR